MIQRDKRACIRAMQRLTVRVLIHTDRPSFTMPTFCIWQISLSCLPSMFSWSKIYSPKNIVLKPFNKCFSITANQSKVLRAMAASCSYRAPKACPSQWNSACLRYYRFSCYYGFYCAVACHGARPWRTRLVRLHLRLHWQPEYWLRLGNNLSSDTLSGLNVWALQPSQLLEVV